MKTLIICNNSFQLIIAIQLKLTLFKNRLVDVWLTDSFPNSEKLVGRIQLCSIFHEVKFVRCHDKNYTKGLMNNIKSIYELNFKTIKNSSFKYEYKEIVFNGLSVMMYELFDYFTIENKDCKFSMMEEGVLSYNQCFAYGKRVKITRLLRALFRRKDLLLEINSYYCFFPELLSRDLQNPIKPISIPMINQKDEKLIKIIDLIFECGSFNCDEKYIYFGSAFDKDGHNINEKQILESIINAVGKELVIKAHPRNRIGDMKCRTIEESEVPWEAIQLANNFEKKILLTTISGSFISITAILNQSTKGYFFCPEIRTKDKYTDWYISNLRSVVSLLKEKGYCKNITICSLEEFISHREV